MLANTYGTIAYDTIAYDTMAQDSLIEIFTVVKILNVRDLFQYLTHYTAIILDIAGRVFYIDFFQRGTGSKSFPVLN